MTCMKMKYCTRRASSVRSSDGADLAGDEVLHAELLAVLGDVPGVEDRVLRALDLADHVRLALVADDAHDAGVHEPRLGLAQHRVELRIDVLAWSR